jgi:HEPN domain-containing protein
LNEKVKYWVDLSDYDFETAEAMLKSGRLLYVGFMCHQTIEKILKAYFNSKFDEPPPYLHNLTLLSVKSGINELLQDELKEIINLLEPLNIEARYPTHKQQLLNSLTNSKCKEILLKTKELQKWVKEKL